MEVWLPVIFGSIAIGVACGYFFRGKRALLFGALFPWLALLAVLLFFEYVLPQDPAGGASMWPVAQIVAGTPAAILGLISAAITRRRRRSNQPEVNRA